MVTSELGQTVPFGRNEHFGPKNPDATESHQNRIVGAPGHAKTDRHLAASTRSSGLQWKYVRIPKMLDSTKRCENLHGGGFRPADHDGNVRIGPNRPVRP